MSSSCDPGSPRPRSSEGSTGSASASRRSSRRPAREARAETADVCGPGARLRLPVDPRRPLGRAVQVPPELLAVRPRRAASLRARAGRGPHGLAPAPLPPVEPRRGRIRRAAEDLPLIFGSPLSPLENLLRSILGWLHSSAGLTWAWSIVALTLMVRLLLVPLMVKQIHSMQNLQLHAPQMKEIQRKYKADRGKQQEELMKFYKENNINPAASCLPLLAQFPVFIALYLVLRHFSKHVPCPGHPANHGNYCVERGDFSWLHGLVPNIAAHASAHWS